MGLADWLDTLKSSLSASQDALTALARPLPDGGTPEAPNPKRADDDAFIAYFAETLTLQQVGKGDESYLPRYNFLAELLHSAATAMYAAGAESFTSSLRVWLALPPQQAGIYDDIIVKINNIFGGGGMQAGKHAVEITEDALNTWPDLGLSEDPEPPDDNGLTPLADEEIVPESILDAVRSRRKDLAAEEKADTNSPIDGQIIHAILQMDYCLSHPRSHVVIDRWYLRLDSYKGLLPTSPAGLKLTDLTDTAATAIREALTTVAGGVKQPDILDVTLREVYEIKPIGKAIAGIRQVFGYLLLLNTFTMGDAAARLLLSNQGPDSTSTTGGVGDAIYLPGHSWTPHPFYFLPPDSLYGVVRPVPGLIIYAKYTVKLPDDLPEDMPITVIGAGMAAYAVTAATVGSAAATGVAAGTLAGIFAEAGSAEAAEALLPLLLAL